MRLYLQITAYAARREGLWDTFLAKLDEYEQTPRGLAAAMVSDSVRAIVGRMPPEWQELAEEEVERRSKTL